MHYFRLLSILFSASIIILLYSAADTQATGGRSMRFLELSRMPASMKNITNWCYQLQKVSPTEIHESKCDLLVIDFYKNSLKGQKYSQNEIALMKTKPDGTRRIVLSYISIGEAENYRPYWKTEWKTIPPKWLLKENPHWKGNFLVDYRKKEWQKIILKYVTNIQSAGFDGIYIDKTDASQDALRLKAFPDIESKAKGNNRQRAYEQSMLDYCLSLFSGIKKGTPGFLIVPQNAEFLTHDSQFINLTDAFGVEDLVYGSAVGGRLTPKGERNYRTRKLLTLLRAGKPIFTVDYVSGHKARNAVKLNRQNGFVPYISGRSLSVLNPPIRP